MNRTFFFGHRVYLVLKEKSQQYNCSLWYFHLGYAEQLSECRESLEQLEGFQNQELAKVKHMLLSAETALELEKQERLRLRDQLEELKKERHPTDQLLSENTFTHNQDASTNTLNPNEASNNETKLSKVLCHNKQRNNNRNGGLL